MFKYVSFHLGELAPSPALTLTSCSSWSPSAAAWPALLLLLATWVAWLQLRLCLWALPRPSPMATPWPHLRLPRMAWAPGLATLRLPWLMAPLCLPTAWVPGLAMLRQPLLMHRLAWQPHHLAWPLHSDLATDRMLLVLP